MLAISVFASLTISCQKQASTNLPSSTAQSDERLNFVFGATESALISMASSKKASAITARAFKKTTCGGHLFGSHSGTGFYTYPLDTLDLTHTSVGSTVKIPVNANFIPNRFSVYTLGNTLLATSGWMGSASYSGPWGASISTPIIGTLTFTRGTDSLYILRTETSFPPGGGQEDQWDATLNCHITGCSGSPCTCTCSCSF